VEVLPGIESDLNQIKLKSWDITSKAPLINFLEVSSTSLELKLEFYNPLRISFNRNVI
jgi:hypothetical protein